MRGWGAKTASLTCLAAGLALGVSTVSEALAQRSGGATMQASQKAEKWKKIPLDVAFPDVKKLLEEAASAQQAAKGAGPAGDVVDWSKFIPADAVVAEIAKVAPLCPDDVKNAGFFKSKGWTAAADHHGQLALLFQILVQYQGDAKYKDVAAGLRTLAAKASFSAPTNNDESFAAAKASTDAVAGLLKNGKSTAPAAEAHAAFADDVVDFGVVMRRMELAQRERLSKYTTTEAEFTAKKADLIHEARMLATLSQVILDSSYPLAAEGDYRSFAEKMRDQCLTAIKAAEAGDFDTANTAVRSVNLVCEGCHGAYR